MKKILANACAVAALALISAPAQAVTPTQQATAGAKIYKPLTISFGQSLDFGTLVLNTGTSWTNNVMKIDQAGTLTGCGTNVTCSGSPQPAMYHLTGTKGASVKITSPGFSMSQAGGSATLAFTPVLTSSIVSLDPTTGALDLYIGGQVSLDSTTPDGSYSGQFLVTADYN
jgi:hypothetical protein